jgi:hypothetical protein
MWDGEIDGKNHIFVDVSNLNQDLTYMCVC